MIGELGDVERKTSASRRRPVDLMDTTDGKAPLGVEELKEDRQSAQHQTNVPDAEGPPTARDFGGANAFTFGT
ncbi:hypothetical protein PtA15_8A633 [Puccinia triticina]|uniref:Uncharacterized protein n=1 Tax=Puccinia triticina TaxID=208348 RepID=A0ABY7CTE6_9BASI|nr:uncharacterized protein PtA15_8A633 [Puccinia triticina]WAQ87727.1 hypothetical protein PtA15_8A633 [Puccinia triticina]WAR57606.1 hypothetical protein PtB15_8B658 [Puccinia triticina]